VKTIAIIGGGPAGLRAAEVAAEGGARVVLFDAMPSPGRKFLVAGRGGLNLTKSEPRDVFATHYISPGAAENPWPALLADFDADSVRAWAGALGVETFAAGTGRVYPREMKAAPLLRRWVHRLRALGVELRMRHRWVALRAGPGVELDFEVEKERAFTFAADAAILALGGASWPETGSDGAWIGALEKLGVSVAPLAPANCGWEFPWPPEVLTVAEGRPLKSIAVRALGKVVAGELLVTRYGLEGGAIYQLGPELRAMAEPAITIDFKPAHTVEQLIAKLGPVRRNFLAEARSRWRLGDAVHAILAYTAGAVAHASAEALAFAVKNCALRLTGPRPIAEAISSAGGVRWNGLDAGLMLRTVPGVFVAGEMIDWEAPTGGYLITGCLATGTHAARAALAWVRARG
jgi:uncharacterized flavoprotein (TIGR03862 family)